MAITQVAMLQQSAEPAMLLSEAHVMPSSELSYYLTYTSWFDKILIANAILKRKDQLRQNALHVVRLHAGQSPMPNGGIGRFAAPQIPEGIGGGLVGINI